MVATKASPLFLFLVLALLVVGVMVLARAPAAALPALTLPVAQQAAAGPALIRSNWGEIELDVDGATLDHAVARHGAAGAEALRQAQSGRCFEAYLECGHDWMHLVDGTLGYFVCQLSDGRFGLVPFRADALVRRLVAMTGYAIRPGYEQYVAQRDGCVPVELALLLSDPQLEDDYGSDR
jgi:hypothetical protein